MTRHTSSTGAAAEPVAQDAARSENTATPPGSGARILAYPGTFQAPPSTPRAEPRDAGRESAERTRWLRPEVLGTTLFFLILVVVAAAGVPYYLLPAAERVRSPLHAMFRSSGSIGQSAGIVAFLFFIFLWLYPLRKRYRALAFTGPIGKWLSVHIVAGLGIPLLVGIHAGWRVQGLAGLSYTAMLIVVASGFVGKYIYSRIPRSRSGLELTLDEMQARDADLDREMERVTGMRAAELKAAMGLIPAPPGRLGLVQILARMFADDVFRARTLKRLRERWSASGPDGRPADPATLAASLRLARQRIALEQQMRLLDATHRVFRFWHAAHKPVAITALLAVLIHVVVVVAVGATWFH